ncbi:MAG TPA: acyl-CoA dehydrogenase family protein, partial [Gammaproteobacteria bacterium]|nr:acyl-CoA dehydrogenase family protein [Gammaproteobacteria bacterium]
MRLTPEHKSLSESVKKFVATEINPYVEAWEQEGMFPAHQLFKKMGDLGFLGITKPEQFGGMGLDWSYNMVFCEAMGEVNGGSIPMAVGVQTDMATPALAKFGSDQLREEFLTPAIAGDYVACIGVSEPGAGSDVSSIRTTARKDGGDYLI